MAEILINIKGPWMDKLSPAEWEAGRAKHPDWDQTYAARHRVGEVVEIRPDGFWSAKGEYPRADVFRVILLPGVAVSKVQHLLQSAAYARRRYLVTTSEGRQVTTVTKVQNLALVDLGVNG